ncbi:SDR family NAD(P)-dependent oxidoreductase [Tetragenococcus muriaticus]|uniref:FabG family protein n=1 Tax=Tetragenococcus muriaticus 3MR10-3 TaxID=1302648 RepID=A0A091BX90_9ENTE|nr:SDR family NAD(P)-dependent oxidoreductase [Tetragenococcus muriaticus]KFN89105.1 FabG family protein [Tetragenococcus muriaticus 3MR10-3]
MAKVFITGSSTGLGALTAKELIAEGSEVVLHARNDTRAEDALKENPEASHVVVGDLSKKRRDYLYSRSSKSIRSL